MVAGVHVRGGPEVEVGEALACTGAMAGIFSRGKRASVMRRWRHSLRRSTSAERTSAKKPR